MKRTDYYIFGLAFVNIYMFVKFAGMVISATVGSVIERGDFWGYVVFASFLVGILVIFRNASQLLSLIPGTETDEATHEILVSVAKYSVLLLGTYALFVFSDAYLMYELYGGY